MRLHTSTMLSFTNRPAQKGIIDFVRACHTVDNKQSRAGSSRLDVLGRTSSQTALCCWDGHTRYLQTRALMLHLRETHCSPLYKTSMSALVASFVQRGLPYLGRKASGSPASSRDKASLTPRHILARETCAVNASSDNTSAFAAALAPCPGICGKQTHCHQAHTSVSTADTNSAKAPGRTLLQIAHPLHCTTLRHNIITNKS